MLAFMLPMSVSFQHVICTGLWCKVEGEKECKTKLDPPMDGTDCDTGKVQYKIPLLHKWKLHISYFVLVVILFLASNRLLKDPVGIMESTVNLFSPVCFLFRSGPLVAVPLEGSLLRSPMGAFSKVHCRHM